MKINIVSDLHLELNGNFFASQGITFEPADILVLAGDIIAAPYLNPDRNEPGARSAKKGIEYLKQEIFPQYKKVFMVMGNHEYYGCFWDKTPALIKEEFKDVPNFMLLDDDVPIVDDVWFIGSTLWTNFNNNDNLAKLSAKDFMNDYRLIFQHTPEEHYKKTGEVTVVVPPITPDFIYQKHQFSYGFIKGIVKYSECKKIVVITHHAPSLKCLNARHHGDILNYAFASDYEQFIAEHPKIKLWISGHTHMSHDFMIGETRLVSNQCGYRGEDCFNQFKANKVVEV